VAVSFSIGSSEGRKRFLIALLIFLFSFMFVKSKKGIGLGILAFIALRFAWAAGVYVFQHLP
jgi:hypothetical protein